jgi:4-diphosphocytidyl-2-C-methyl-D-erythritol kinase
MLSSKNDHVRLRAFAKINLSLKILGKRDDGYHDIDSIMLSVSLHDEIILKPSDAGITVNCSTPGIKNNIVQRASELLFTEAKIKTGADITIKKNIPLSAGLGGGSADAAATLVGLNSLFGLNMHIGKLMEIAAKLGADVPFCLVGGTARCLGIGDKIEKINPKTGSAFLLVMPRIQVSTRDVYNRYDEIGSGDSDNELERAAFGMFPKIGEIRETLDGITRKGWKMSGSGPALYLELMDLSESEKYLPLISKLDCVNHLVKRMDFGVELF